MKQDGVRDEYMIDEFDNYKILYRLHDNNNKIVLSILTEFKIFSIDN